MAYAYYCLFASVCFVCVLKCDLLLTSYLIVCCLICLVWLVACDDMFGVRHLGEPRLGRCNLQMGT